MIGGVVFIGSLNLHYFGTVSLWGIATRGPILLTVLAAIAIALALAAMTWDAPVLCLGQAVLGAYLLGQVFPIGAASYEGLKIGFWLSSISALAMTIGGALAVVGNYRRKAGT
jgi:hypothetical protein